MAYEAARSLISLKTNDLGFNFVQEERNEQIVPNNRNITPSTS